MPQSLTESDSQLLYDTRFTHSFDSRFMHSWHTHTSRVSFHYITSTKNSLGLPMAKWKDCLDAVSSGGTEPRSRVGGAPGGPPGLLGSGRPGWMGVPAVWGWGAPIAGCGCCGTITIIMGLYGIGMPGGYGVRWGGGARWCERWLAWLCSLGVAEPWSLLKLLRTEYSDSLPLPERESPPLGDLSSRVLPATVLPLLLPLRLSPSLRVEPLLRLPRGGT